MICGSSVSAFLPFGLVPRANAQCPVCGALERHRQAWLAFREETDLFDARVAKRFLHFAPEPELSTALRALPRLVWVGADIASRRATMRTDITRLAFADHSFDVLYCSHVLEHIPDDRAALAELFRILKPDGWGALQVPQQGAKTFEDPSVQDPRERERLFGQNDHVRIYGDDFADRLREAGFHTKRSPLADGLDERTKEYLGLRNSDPLYFVTKSGV